MTLKKTTNKIVDLVDQKEYIVYKTPRSPDTLEFNDQGTTSIIIWEYVIQVEPGTHMWYLKTHWLDKVPRTMISEQDMKNARGFYCPISAIEVGGKTAEIARIQRYDTSPDRLQVMGIEAPKGNFDFYKVLGCQLKDWKQYIAKRTQ